MNHNHDLERQVLSTMILGTPTECWRRLRPDDFTFSHHATIFLVTCRLLDAGYTQPGIQTVLTACEDLKADVTVQEIAGALSFEPVNFEAACRALRRLNQSRLVSRSRVAENHDPGAFMEASEALGRAIRDLAWDQQQSDDFLAVAFDRHERLRTGLESLDRLAGGIGPQEYVVVGARPSVGKSAMALTVALNAADMGLRVLFVSLEQTVHAQTWRALAHLERWESSEPKHDPRKWETTILRGHETLTAMPLKIVSPSDWSLGAVSAEAFRAKEKDGLDLVIVDYLQLVQLDARTEYERVTRVASGLKHLTRKLNCPLIACAQVRRPESGSNRKPTMNDLKSSGQIEQDADQVWLLHRDYDETGTVRGREALVIVDKNREGQTGTVALEFTPHQYRFSDKSFGWEPAQTNDWRHD